MRLLWLQEAPGIGPAALGRILETYQGDVPIAFFGQPAAWYARSFRLSAGKAGALADHAAAVPVRLASITHLPLRMVTLWDPEYPSALRALPRPPPMLALHGRLRGWDETVCVVCSAEAENEHGFVIKEALRSAVSAGRTIVTGHNRMVYQWGLLAAKRAGAPCCLVLDRGLLQAFDDDLTRDPVATARIWGYGFDADVSLAVSPFRLWNPWIGANSRLRDEIVLALSREIVAAGVREGGTMHRLCRLALARGQTIYATPDTLPLLAEAGATPWNGYLHAPAQDETRAEKPGHGESG